MIKKTILWVILFTCSISFAQTEFLKGSYMTINGSEVTCYILNEEWNEPPDAITYKKELTGEPITLAVKAISSFRIDGITSYVKSRTNIDMSPDRTDNLNNVKVPDWERRTMMLKTLVEGNASLYSYENEGLKRYFYSTEGSTSKIEQLVYKRYIDKTTVIVIAHNNFFKQQLVNAFFSCQAIDKNEILNLSYDERTLMKIFEKYNSCKNESFESFEQEKVNVEIKLKAKAGISSTSYELVVVSVPTFGGDFGTKSGARFEVEVEALPFKNRSWGFFGGLAKDPDYKKSIMRPTSSEFLPDQEITIDYGAIEMPIGVRHYANLGGQARISLHAGYSFNFPTKNSINYSITTDQNSRTTSIGGNFFGGVGLNFGKIFAEGRLGLGRRIFKSNNSTNNVVSLVLGYEIL